MAEEESAVRDASCQAHYNLISGPRADRFQERPCPLSMRRADLQRWQVCVPYSAIARGPVRAIRRKPLLS